MHVEFRWTKEQYPDLVATCLENPMTPYIREYMPKDKPILEAGCGLGQFVKFFSDLSYDMHGIEVSENAVNIVNSIEPKLKIIQGDIEQLPYPDNYFGGLTCFGVVEHIVNGPQVALSELYRVLAPGGTALISVPVFSSLRKFKHYTGLAFVEYYVRKAYHFALKKDMDWLYKDILKPKHLKYHHWPATGGFFEYRFSRDEISSMLREANFSIIKEVPLEGLGGLYHELGGKIINLSRPSRFAQWLDRTFAPFPFSHHHTYLAVVKKN